MGLGELRLGGTITKGLVLIFGYMFLIGVVGWEPQFAVIALLIAGIMFFGR